MELPLDKWIVITDRPPPEDFPVLVACDTYREHIFVAERSIREVDAYITYHGYVVFPTHWRYLPVPPGKEGHD